MLGAASRAEAGVAQLGSQLADFFLGLRLQRLGQAGRGSFEQRGHAVGALGDAASRSLRRRDGSRNIVEPCFGAGFLWRQDVEQQPCAAGHAAEDGELGQERAC